MQTLPGEEGLGGVGEGVLEEEPAGPQSEGTEQGWGEMSKPNGARLRGLGLE